MFFFFYHVVGMASPGREGRFELVEPGKVVRHSSLHDTRDAAVRVS